METNHDSVNAFMNGDLLPEHDGYDPDALARMRAMATTRALDKMFHNESFFSICTIDSLMKMHRIVKTIEVGQVYDVLRSMHCVHYDTMTRAEVRELKKMCLFVLGVNVVETPPPRVEVRVTEPFFSDKGMQETKVPAETVQKKGFLRYLLPGK